MSRSGDIEARSVRAGTQASFEASSGDIHVMKTTAGTRVHLRTQSGQACANNVQAEQIHLETVSGDADLREVAGALTVKTISGDVEGSGADSPAISLVTVSGDTRWAVPGPFSGAWSGTTVSGDLRLRQERLAQEPAPCACNPFPVIYL